MNANNLVSALSKVPMNREHEINLGCIRIAIRCVDEGDIRHIIRGLNEFMDRKLAGKDIGDGEWDALHKEADQAEQEAHKAERKANAKRVTYAGYVDKATRKRREAQARPRALAQVRKYTLEEERAEKLLVKHTDTYREFHALYVYAKVRKRAIELLFHQPNDATIPITELVLSALFPAAGNELINNQLDYIRRAKQ